MIGLNAFMHIVCKTIAGRLQSLSICLKIAKTCNSVPTFPTVSIPTVHLKSSTIHCIIKPTLVMKYIKRREEDVKEMRDVRFFMIRSLRERRSMSLWGRLVLMIIRLRKGRGMGVNTVIPSMQKNF